MAIATEGKDERSLGQLLRELTHESSHLLRQEVSLAKTEMGEKASRVGAGLAEAAVGGGVALLGGIALLLALVFGLGALLDNFLSRETASWLAPLIVGGVLAAVGYSLVNRALIHLKHEGLTPRKTTQSLKENKEWLQHKMS